MNQFFWNNYRRLEKEVLALSEYIHISDDQLQVYSSRISDLLVRTAIEFESLAKVLYYDNGGVKPEDRDLIVNEVSRLLEDAPYYYKMSKAVNPYGDGLACGRIVKAFT